MTGGSDGCCARAASGHAAAKPATLMRSRRLIVAPEAQTAMVAIRTGALEGAGVANVRFVPISGHRETERPPRGGLSEKFDLGVLRDPKSNPLKPRAGL